jgi:hypothetical protein
MNSIWEEIWGSDHFYAEVWVIKFPIFCMAFNVQGIRYDRRPRWTTLWVSDKRGHTSPSDTSTVADNTSCWKKELML